MSWQRFGAIHALLRLHPESLYQEAGGLRVRRIRDFALCDALRHAPPSTVGWLTSALAVSHQLIEPTVLDAASCFSPVPVATIGRALAESSQLRRAALLAAARHAETADFAADAASEALRDPEPGMRLVAAYALGLAKPAEFVSRVERTLGREALTTDVDPLVVGLFGGPAAVPELLRAASGGIAPDEHIHALGLAGDSRSFALLIERCDPGEAPSIRAAAVHALRCITGAALVRPFTGPRDLIDSMVRREPMARDRGPSEGAEVDLDAARALVASGAFVPGIRYHVGAEVEPLRDASDLPTSYAWLRAVVNPAARCGALHGLACEVPDALVPGEGYGAISMGPDHLFAAHKALA